MLEFKVSKAESPLGWSMVDHETEYMGNEAKLAWSFADKILLSDGMKEAMQEMSSAQQRQTVKEIAARACELAEYLMIEMRERDWIYKAPTIKQADKLAK